MSNAEAVECTQEQKAQAAEFWYVRLPTVFDGSEIEGQVCFDHTNLYVQSENLSDTFAEILITYEHCVESDPSEQTCADEQATLDFWKSGRIFLMIDTFQVEMQNAT